MSATSPLLIVVTDPEELQPLVESAALIGYPNAHVVTGNVDQWVAALKIRVAPPEFILLDIGNRSRDILVDIDELALHCPPTVRVAVIGSVNDIIFYRELKQRGVAEYFTRPADIRDIRNVLLQAPAAATNAHAKQEQGQVISVMSAASGDGGSTLSLNLAYALAEEFKQPTVLIDMDYQFGLLTKSLDLTASFGIRELFEHPDRGLDRMLVQKMLVRYSDNLNIIAAPNDLRLLPTIRPEIIRDLIVVLRSQYKYVVVDLPHMWTDWTAAMLTYSDHAYLVSQLWLRSLTHAARLIAAWQNVGVSGDNVSIVINRSGAKFKEGITVQDFERITHHKIDAHINNDVKAVVYAENHGKTLYETATTGSAGILRQQIHAIAKRRIDQQAVGLMSSPEAAPEPGLQAKKPFLALFDKRSS